MPSSVSVDVQQLIKWLGSDDSDQRDRAQAQLVALGQSVVPALKVASAGDSDPEVRSRASAALSQLLESASFDATSITLHQKDASAKDVFNLLGTQAGLHFSGGLLFMPKAAIKRVTIDADHKPAWDVLSDLCSQSGQTPRMDNLQGDVSLFESDHNWIVQPTHRVVGPYLISVSSLNRSRTVDLTGPAKTGDNLSVHLMVYPEPKLVVTRISDFTVDEASDDAGNKLELNGPAVDDGSPKPPAFLQVSHAVEISFKYPAHPGTTIKTLRGHIEVMLASSFQRCRFDDVLDTQKATNPLRGCQVDVKVNLMPHLNAPGAGYMVSIDCRRQGSTDNEWAAVLNHFTDLTLQDGEGHSLGKSGVAYMEYDPQLDHNYHLKIRAYFSTFKVRAADTQPSTWKTGHPKTLIWNVPSTFKKVLVPVNFKDLPMP